MPFEIVGSTLYDLDTGEAVASMDGGQQVGALSFPLSLAGARPQSAARPPLQLSPALINAMGARLRASSPTMLRTLSLQGPAQPQLREVAPGSVDETPLPITETAVAAGATEEISINSQIIFAPRRLIVPDSLAPFFTISGLSVGNVPLFAGNGSIPAEAFRPDSVAPNIRKITAQPGVPLVLRVTNIDAVAHTFRGAIFGLGSQPQGCY